MSVFFISHRGESMDAPENTLEAFRLSAERDTDGFETDIHWTKDRKIVCSHDASLARMGGMDGDIREMDYAEICKVNVSNGEPGYPTVRVPLFSEALGCVKPNRKIYVEVKDDDVTLLNGMFRELREAKLSPEQAVIISFKSEMIRQAKLIAPEYQALLLCSSWSDAGGFLHPTPQELVHFLKELHADGVDMNIALASEEMVTVLHGEGLLAAVWTADYPSQVCKLLGMGVDSITSNRAAALKQFFNTGTPLY